MRGHLVDVGTVYGSAEEDMAYARIGWDSDVYVFSDGKMLGCYGCCLHGQAINGYFVDHAYPDAPVLMAAHLTHHREHGDKVPDHTFERLSEEALHPRQEQEQEESDHAKPD
jgi:hypothetical protein